MTQQAGALKSRVGSGELRTVLESVLACHPGVCQRIAKLERRLTLYCTSSTIEELSAHLADGTTLELIFKNLSREALLETARRVKPAFLYDPLREIETYRTVLARSALGTAICYGTVVDHDIGRYWLFLERVPGLELYQVGDLATWQQVARWLASMHTCFVGKTESLARSAPLLRYDSDFYRLWMGRAQTFLDRAESSQPEAVRHRIKRLAKRYDRVVEHLLALPATFIHGEFYASNVLVHSREEQLRVCPVDWEMAAVGPGLIDLAALTAGRWTVPERTTLSMAYFAESTTRGAQWSGSEEFLTALDHCRLHVAVQWLGWSSEWSPPLEHTQDWLSEALSLSEKLGLA